MSEAQTGCGPGRQACVAEARVKMWVHRRCGAREVAEMSDAQSGYEPSCQACVAEVRASVRVGRRHGTRGMA